MQFTKRSKAFGYFSAMSVIAMCLLTASSINAAPTNGKQLVPETSLYKYADIYESTVSPILENPAGSSVKTSDGRGIFMTMSKALEELEGIKSAETASWDHYARISKHLEHLTFETKAWLGGPLHPEFVRMQDQATLRRLTLQYGQLNRALNDGMFASRLAAVLPGQWEAVNGLRRSTRAFQYIAGHALDLLDENRTTFSEARNHVKQTLGLLHL